ncbi:carboxypeptidase M32 [Pseudoruegeria sp. SK021]|uniref:carboxypeptidase M32 n=1 Tax=Pseudoruegeria sp. SK021 TaxID=1933035 RepID=UPI000A221F39|nr:carboxypeptidase M32 [Pseudoruegeria sp. SK021]OSP56361.1 carboxypeptidase M32 [Pseudoruegeria sp. SK021]
MSAYNELMAFSRETNALAAVAGRLGWDQETVMPRGAAAQRSDEMSAMEGILHARRCDPRVGDWLADAGVGSDPVEAANLRLLKRDFDRASKVPAALSQRLARVTSLAQGEWAAARAADDFAAFAPRLAEVVDLKRQEAAALVPGGVAYDALLADYEPGVTAADLDQMFGALRPRLVALRDQAFGIEQPPAITGEFSEQAQMVLGSELARVFGYDLNRGRIDKAVHPFSSGSGVDVRITTRTDPADPFNCFYSTIHEVGHACYEQAVDLDYLLTPIGRGTSMGVHESQSRTYENQLGRSRAFCGWLYGRMKDEFGPLSIRNEDEFYRTVNRVGPGFIRTEADEVQYNLHVLMRYDLEKAMISGALDVRDLEDAWNTRFRADFGRAVPKASLGVLQDVHWSVGLFGYFPTYSLGNVYAGCLFKALKDDIPALDAHLSAGDPSPATAWLAERVQRHGALRDGRETIEHATGAAPSEGPLLDYLEAKFGEMAASD